MNLPVIHKGEDFNIILSESSLEFKEKEIVFENPNQNNSFPLSFSVIFKENIVSLFEPGTFVCHKLSDFSRNEELEWIIRSMLTPFMVIISNSLVLVSLVELSTKKSCDGRKNQTNESDKTVTSATPTR